MERIKINEVQNGIDVVSWIVRGDKGASSFTLRNKFVALPVATHRLTWSHPEAQLCNFAGDRLCYCDGTSIGGVLLWAAVKDQSSDEQDKKIFSELEEVYDAM